MTVMTAMEGLTAPARAASVAALPTETWLPDEPALLPSRRGDGWTAAAQRAFLEAIAEGHGVEAACARVGLSATSAYAFRRTAKGAAFALGWRAATLVARDCIAEMLLVRALQGQIDTVVRDDGSSYTRHRHDNRLAMALLARLDRQVAAATDADVQAARLVAQEFDAFLGLVERDDGPARAGLFLAGAAATAAQLAPGAAPAGPGGSAHGTAARGTPAARRASSDAAGLSPVAAPAIATLLAPIYALAAADRLARTGHASAADVPVADLDPHARADWTAEQWARAEAAGLVALAPPPPPPAPPAPETAPASQESQHWWEEEPWSDPADDPDRPVWWDPDTQLWRTRFPPPEDFAGEEDGRFGEEGYSRELTEDEAATLDAWHDRDTADARAAGAAARDAFFALDGYPAPPLREPDAPVPSAPAAPGEPTPGGAPDDAGP